MSQSKKCGILVTKSEKGIGQKRSMSYEIIRTIIVRGLQHFDKYDQFNLIQVKIDGNKIVADLAGYQKFKYRFVVDGLLFSSAILNDTNIIFVICTGLNDAK